MTASPENSSQKPTMRVKIAHFVDAQGDQPAGVRVVEPPPDTRQTLRGNIYAVVELSGDNPGREELSERMLSAIQRTYYTSRGSQSEVLHQAVISARQKADEFNQFHEDNPLEAGIICVGLVQTRLMILYSGPALALVTSGSAIERYPADILNFDRIETDADPEFYRQDISGGCSLFIGGAGWLDEVPLRTLAATVAHVDIDNCTAAAFGLREQYALADLPGLLVVVEPVDSHEETSAPEVAPPAAAPSAPSSVDEPARTPPPARPAVPAGLPTAVNTEPPVRSMSTADDASVDESPSAAADIAPSGVQSDAGESDAGRSDGSAAPAVGAFAGASALKGIDAVDPGGQLSDEQRSVEPGAGGDAVNGGDDHGGAGPSEMAASVAAGAQAGMQKAKDMVASILPDRQSSESGDSTSEIDNFDRHVDELAAVASAGASEEPSNFEQTLAQVQEESFAPPSPTRGRRARLFILLALLILALVPILVAAVYWRMGANQNVEAETRIELTEAHLSSAIEALNMGDKVTGRAELSKAQVFLDEATAMRGPSARTDELAAQIQRELQDVLQVRTLQGLVEPLVRFPGDALPHRVLVVGQDIYVLDTGRQVVERYQLDSSREFVPDQRAEIVLREGDVIDGVTVGRLVDFAWQPPVPGYDDKANLIVLDRNNQLFRYNARVEGASHIQLGDPAALQVPNNLNVYNGRTYITDEGVQQLLRYDLGGFGQTPEPWFSAQTTANLAGLLTMVIDGDIWLLYSNGMLLRYASGEQVPFSLEGGVGQVGEPVDMALGFDDDAPIYIADTAQDRIMVFDKSGGYLSQLVAPERDQLTNLRGLYIDEFSGTLYILTQSSLFQHPLPD